MFIICVFKLLTKTATCSSVCEGVTSVPDLSVCMLVRVQSGLFNVGQDQSSPLETLQHHLWNSM